MDPLHYTINGVIPTRLLSDASEFAAGRIRRWHASLLLAA